MFDLSSDFAFLPEIPLFKICPLFVINIATRAIIIAAAAAAGIEMEILRCHTFAGYGAKRRFTQYPRIWRRRISISIPAAAAAAIIIALVAIFITNSGQILNNGFAGKKLKSDDRSNIILAAEEEIPGIIPAATDLNDVLQYLGADNSDIIILRLPESRNFSRVGEPAIIRAADYSRSRP